MISSSSDNSEQKQSNKQLGMRRSWLRLIALPTVIAIVVAVAMYFIASAYVMKEAEEHVQNLLLSHRALHHYIQRVMHPAFYRDRDAGEIPKSYYSPEILSSSFIVRVMHAFHNEERIKAGLLPAYYKLASVNPRNPVNKADEFEAGLIRKFNEQRDLKKYRSVITVGGNKYLYYAIPFLETNNACTRCHGDRSAAPPGLQRIYTGSGGFDEQTNRIRAIESIRVPITHEIDIVVIVVTAVTVFIFVGLILLVFNRRLRSEVTNRTIELEQEIAERLKAEEDVKSLAQRLQLATAAGHLGVWDWNVSDNTMVWDDQMFILYGITREAFPSTLDAWTNGLHPDDKATAIADCQAALRGEKQFDTTFRVCHPDGIVKHIKANGLVIRGTDGAAERMIGVNADVTENVLAEETLRESNERFSSAFNGMPVMAIISTLEDGTILDLNQQAQDGFGISREETIGKTATELGLLTKADRAVLIEKLQKDGRVQGYELNLHTKSGQALLCKYWGEIITFSGKQRLLSIAQDITENRRIEQQFIQAQKMESVGRLAGGVAHDFNNMLSVILGHADLGLLRIDSTHPISRDLEEIRKAAERSADLTRQLLSFARQQVVEPKVLNLNEAITGMLKMLQRLIGENIHLAWHPAPEVWPIKIDPSQLDQILANLCVNARDAIDGNGRITIETENCTIDADHCAVNPDATPGDYVRFTISDDGHGMDKETIGHIFEPFFTTKENGKGTGLGLSTVYGVAKQNNGFINIYSELGRGSTFSVYLPRHNGSHSLEQQDDDAIPIPLGNETILLVEDEPAILSLITSMLEKLGYKVLQANNPSEAIQIVQDYKEEIHMLMTDVIMPEMNGMALSDNLLSTYPSLKRLFMSGYTADIIANHGVLDSGMGYIQKPFTLLNMAVKIREVLDAQ